MQQLHCQTLPQGQGHLCGMGPHRVTVLPSSPHCQLLPGVMELNPAISLLLWLGFKSPGQLDSEDMDCSPFWWLGQGRDSLLPWHHDHTTEVTWDSPEPGQGIESPDPPFPGCLPAGWSPGGLIPQTLSVLMQDQSLIWEEVLLVQVTAQF